MKRTILFFFWALASTAMAQDTTSVFELKLYNTSNKLVSGKDVDLYQNAAKKYDLTESSSIPGVYSATVRTGEYDIYVNGSSWKTGIWIGSNKVTMATDRMTFYSGGKSTARFDTVYGYGGNLTGVTGSVVDAPDDLELKADSNDDRVGKVQFKLADTTRAEIQYTSSGNETNMIVGNSNSLAAAAFEPSFQHHSRTSSTISATQIAGGGARYALLQVDQANNRIIIGSWETGDPTGPDLWPADLAAGTKTTMRLDTLDNVIIIGTANSKQPAAWLRNTLQLHANDTTGTIAVVQISGSGARYAFLQVDDITGRVVSGSTETGNPSGDDLWPYDLIAGGKTVMRLDTLDNVVIIGDENGQVPAAYTQNTFQIHGDSTVSLVAVRIYGGGTGARYAILQVDDYDDVVKLVSTKTGTVPGSNAWPLEIWIGGEKVLKLAEDSVVVEKKIIARDVIEKQDQVGLSGGAWYGATRDTISAMIPAISFADTGGDTAFYDLQLPGHAVRIDSVWLDITTESTAGDSSRFVLGAGQIDFGDSYSTSFTTQNSTYADMSTGNVRSRVKFTSSIALDPNYRLVLKLFRDNSISNNAAAPVKLAGAMIFGRGLR